MNGKSDLQIPLVALPAEGPLGDDGSAGEGYYAAFDHRRSQGGGETSSLLSEDEGDEFESQGPRPRGLDAAFQGFFRRGHDVEGAGVNHQYTREERSRLADVESIEYLPPNSAVYRRWLASQPHGRLWDRWFMMGSIGVVVGIIGYMLFTVIELCAHVKLHTVRWLLTHTNIGLAWLFNMAFSLALVGISTWTVVEIAPQAAGAGVAEVTAYLNGCLLPKVFNIQTLIVKFVSCAAAVGSGLPVGPEGPMVHIGAMVGGALSQGHSTTLGFSTGLFQRFRNPKDKRDFVTAGTAVGIATAFGAPIGGLLFAMEELASSFSQALGSQIFFACMLAVLTLDTARSAQRSLSSGHFGSFDGDATTVFFEVQTQLANHVAAMAPAALIGVACGGLAILFTAINIKVARARAATLQGRKLWRMAEPCVLMALFVTLGMLLPLFFPCTPTQCVVAPGDSAPTCAPGSSENIKRIVEQSLELYTCSGRASDDSEMPESDTNTTSFRNYNELATLLSVTGESAIKHLLSRGTHREFGYAALLVMLVFYFSGAVWAAGSAIASGLFVPMLLIGSCVGRIVGLIAVDIAAKWGHGSPGAPPGVFTMPSPWAWIDPGAFALIGAGAFMGGVTRLTISLAVIMMEVSNDVRMLLPLLVGILVAKWVADAATHPLYHALLEVKCVPWLPSEPPARRALDLVPTAAAMAAPVVTAAERMRLDAIRALLRDTRHNGFPVVRDTPAGQVFVGLVVRDHLMVLLRRALARRPGGPMDDLTYEDLNRQFVSAAARTMVSEQQMAVLQGRSGGGVPSGSAAAFEQVLDLGPYINTSAPTVHEDFSLERTYMVFRNLGLRHLTVTDAHGHVKGIITRKDLLGFRLDEAVERSRLNGTFAATGLRHRSPGDTLADGDSYA